MAERLPRTDPPIERLEGHERADVAGLAFQEPFVTTDRSARLAELLGPDLALPEHRRHEDRGVVRTLGLALEILDQLGPGLALDAQATERVDGCAVFGDRLERVFVRVDRAIDL